MAAIPFDLIIVAKTGDVERSDKRKGTIIPAVTKVFKYSNFISYEYY
jgi:hypothetical protein